MFLFIVHTLIISIVAFSLVFLEMSSGNEDVNLQIASLVRNASLFYRKFKINVNRLIDKDYDKKNRERKIDCMGFLLAELLSVDFDYELESRTVLNNYLEKYYDSDFVFQVGQRLDFYLYSETVDVNQKRNIYEEIKKLYSKIERSLLLDMIHEIGAVGGINEEEWNLLLTVAYELGLDGKDRDFYYYKYYSDKRKRKVSSETNKKRKTRQKTKCQPKTMYTNMGVYYAVLGLPDGASVDEVKSAYRSLSKKWHPDTILDENLKKLYAQRFIEVNDAYKKLISVQLTN